MIEKNEMIRDHLIVGTFPQVMDKVTLLVGTTYKRGSVLGIVTANGKATLVDSAKADGSQTAHAVLAETVDATAADKVASVYLSGEFNEDALVFGGTDTKATHRSALRNLNIYLKQVGN
jgi:hypothetical protein